MNKKLILIALMYFKKLCLVVILLALLMACGDQSKPNSPNTPFGLLIDLISNIELAYISDIEPEFSWIVNDDRQNELQLAFNIQVFKIEGDFDSIHWDSGRLQSSESSAVSYQGPSLIEHQRYKWRVRTWDSNDNVSPYSKFQHFEIAPYQALTAENSNWKLMSTEKTSFYASPDRETLVKEIIPPIIQKINIAGNTFIDFGKSAFSSLLLKLNATEAGIMTLHIGESSNNDIVNKAPEGSVRYQKITLNYNPNETEYTIDIPMNPRHNVPEAIKMPAHIGEVTPFRFVEIEPSSSKIENLAIFQNAVIYKFDDHASEFHSSNQILNDIWEFSKYSIKATSFMGLYIDGDRERIPYEGDAYINQLSHYYTDREFSLARQSHEFLMKNPNWPTEWLMHSVLIAWADYMHTNDTESLTRFYTELKSKSLIDLERSDGLISTSSNTISTELIIELGFSADFDPSLVKDLVDWPPSERDDYEFNDYNSVVNAFHYKTIELLAKIAMVTNHNQNSTFFKEHAAKIKQSFNNSFYNQQTGLYLDSENGVHSSLHSNVFALVFGLVEPTRQQPIIEFITSKKMACSVYVAQYLLESLYDAGEGDTALNLMTNLDTDRSWPHMIYTLGSTISLEAWDIKYKSNLDWNHAWGAAPANIIPRKICGVEPTQPGYKEFNIKPSISNIKNGYCKVPSIKGSIEVSWENNGKIWDIKTPPNTVANFYPPKSSYKEILINEKKLKIQNSIQLYSGKHLINLN